MANALVHTSVGTAISKVEFEAVGLHVCESQATGDLIYASSASQLSRLGITADRILGVSGGVPVWTNTLPAVTLGGNITGGSQSITSIAQFLLNAYSYGSSGLIGSMVNNSLVVITGGADIFGGMVLLYGKTHATTPGRFEIDTPDAALTSAIPRLVIPGGANQTVATWSATHQDFGANYTSYTETTAPGAGAANTARIYAVVDGGTLTDLAAVFQDGTVDIFAQEVTPLDAPTFTYPSGTEVKTILRKEHPGLVKIVSQFPDGSEFVLKEIEYHDPEKIAANQGTEKPLPKDWLIEDAKQRAARLEIERTATLPKSVKVK